MYNISLLPVAEVELNEAEAWYESQTIGLGQDFHDEVDQYLVRIAENPLLYAVARRDLRRAVMKRFPFSLFYRVTGHNVFVTAVFHHKRRPHYWRRR